MFDECCCHCGEEDEDYLTLCVTCDQYVCDDCWDAHMEERWADEEEEFDDYP